MIGFTTGDDSGFLYDKEVSDKYTEKSILEEFPEYDFVLAQNEFTKISRRIIAFGVIPIFWGGFVVLLITNAIGKFIKIRSYTPRIVYIQKPQINWYKARPIQFIIDENRQWGLVRSDMKILIEPQYDRMKWIEEYKLIEAWKDGGRRIVDINNNICI